MAALLFPTLVPAQTVVQEPIVVTATRTARTADETLASVTVITREDIERTQAKSVAELLTGETGLDAAVNGGYGKTTSLYLRGTNSDHTLVLIDGVKINSATNGIASWQYLPVEQIERIEVVRGPRSSLYGADALGGVVQIFTRQPTDKFQGNAGAGFGTYGTRNLSAGVSGAEGGTRYSLSAGHTSTDGIDSRTSSSGNEGDRDGYRNESLAARVTHRFAQGAEIEAHALYAQGLTEFDGNPNQTAFIQDATGVKLSFSPTNIWGVKLQAGSSRDYTDGFKNGARGDTFNTLRNLVSWQNDVTTGTDQLLTLGLDYQDDRIGSTQPYAVNERNNKGTFAQHQGRFGSHDVLVSLRRDDNEQFGVHNTGNLAWGHALSPALRGRLSYGTAFKAPTFNQLYYPNYGSSDLKPEKSRSYEAGLRGKQAWGSWDVRAFQTRVENLIATVQIGSDFVAQNVDTALIKGLEAEASMALAGWNTRTSLTLLDPRDTGRDKLLTRRAKRSLKFDADHPYGKWRVGGSLLVQGHRYDDVNNVNRVGGYGLLSLRAQYDMSKQWVFRANLDNAFDKDYETARTYKSPGRTLFFSLGYRTN
ncbi:MAG: TonB-dependent vitamin B12 receptor [Gammaproteobacteria bacterium]|nr:MAG: TonB-dependent vitamin B12 receptor [Gammaproteobacteria bacterium]